MIDIDAVTAHYTAYRKSHDHPGAFACCSAHASADDVPELLEALELAQINRAILVKLRKKIDAYLRTQKKFSKSGLFLCEVSNRIAEWNDPFAECEAANHDDLCRAGAHKEECEEAE